ncbi:MAG TPA: glutamate formimidoyltransferase [Bacillota bacterium]|nr:glutamate formimidoyltransferase [Candidatus Fermentithermobacillaceae bacterium]HOB30121.1 glutamate formimidoyltransferase [Bacillota bacterium]HOK64011.1 glutamate formimidoyltransferase [Bacillota bacterium]HOL11366.1 glutamate formimidoyltransferase [Bacillota bacterium]HOQ02495.1 glutamate formimidoyltransferase [Bacillota bacterium]
MKHEKIVECVPNFSEGRDESVIKEILKVIEESGCKILDHSMDPSHNRAVVTFVGNPEQVAEGAFNATKRASQLIDMEKHQGEHPRIGATDVIPFVPIHGVTMEECVELAKEVGKRIGEELGIPVYLYAKAATRPDRVRLPDIRKGEYEGLKEAIKTDPNRKPDFGPSELHPKAGATAVGARPPLIAFNVNLNTDDLKIAKTIARHIRESSGGLPCVQAKGIMIHELGLAQVTMNLLDYKTTPMHVVMSKIEEEAAAKGVEIVNSEIIGLVPLDALLDVSYARLKLKDFSRNRILDLLL